MNRTVSRIVHTIASLRVAIVILLLLAIYIVIGTLIPQHSAPEWYRETYPNIAPIILALSLDSSYSSPLFMVLVSLFALNLGSCSLLSLKGQMKQARHDYFPPFSSSESQIESVSLADIETYCRKGHFSIVRGAEPEKFKAGKFRWGVFGATITHIGLLVLFVGGLIGNMMATEQVVSMLPGNEVSFAEEGFVIRLDDFYMTFEEGGAVKQYVSEVTLLNDDGSEREETLWVNRPLAHNGVKFYQASFGWTGNLQIVDRETEEVVVDGLLRSGRTYFHQPSHLTVYLYGYYPEMAIGHDQQPLSLSNRERNPYYAVILYEFGNPIGSYIIEPGDPIIHENLSITFTHSVAYTGLLVRTDPSYPIVLTGFIIILLGMFMSFYCYPRFISFSGGTVVTASRKNGWVFANSVRTALQRIANNRTREE
jgi:cytochrome c biogenesis protein